MKFNTQDFIPIVLCAGFGSRLRPLTNYYSKVICPLGDTPAAFFGIEQMLKLGFTEIHCNTHYLAEDVVQCLKQTAAKKSYNPNCLVFWHESTILGTGGAIARIYNELIKKDSSYKNRDAIVFSGDIIAEIPLKKMITTWQKKEANDLALMCTRDLDMPRSDVTWVSKDKKHVLGFGKDLKNSPNVNAKIFTTHQIISHNLLKNEPIKVISSIDLYFRKAIKSGKNIININFTKKNRLYEIDNFNEYFKSFARWKADNKFKPKNLQIQYLPKILQQKIEDFVLHHKKYKHQINNKNSLILEISNHPSFKESLCFPLSALESSDKNPNSKEFIFSIKSDMQS